MALVTFTSETGMFHSACRVTWARSTEWYGFQPAVHRRPVSDGKVDRTDRTPFINYSVTFEIADSLTRLAVTSTSAEYATKSYILGVCDCVSFTADIARACRRGVPWLNLTPYGFIQVLAFWNSYVSKT